MISSEFLFASSFSGNYGVFSLSELRGLVAPRSRYVLFCLSVETLKLWSVLFEGTLRTLLLNHTNTG